MSDFKWVKVDLKKMAKKVGHTPQQIFDNLQELEKRRHIDLVVVSGTKVFFRPRLWTTRDYLELGG